MPQVQFNRKAGFRRMPVTRHVEMIEHNAEALAAAERLRQIVYAPTGPSLLRLLAELDAVARAIAESMKAANELATQSEYLPPAAPQIPAEVLS